MFNDYGHVIPVSIQTMEIYNDNLQWQRRVMHFFEIWLDVIYHIPCHKGHGSRDNIGHYLTHHSLSTEEISLDFFTVSATTLRACNSVNYDGHVFTGRGEQDKKRQPNFSPEISLSYKRRKERGSDLEARGIKMKPTRVQVNLAVSTARSVANRRSNKRRSQCEIIKFHEERTYKRHLFIKSKNWDESDA